MKRALSLIIVLLALTLGCQRGQDASLLSTSLHAIAAAETSTDREAQWQQYDQRQQREALMGDARNSYRVCNTRPQRLLPSQGAKNERTTGKPSPLDRYHFTSHCKHFLAGKDRLETAPFQFVVSRDYYIIALRRILR